ncbi:hypothetical protein [Devosia beringensis]|uniref:hypothetical protein n=1 Tax=Devosia beringensis TaxID=2657486 RepID=UPI00186B70B6|nr:hypothetical protein [Devosia beringensis]
MDAINPVKATVPHAKHERWGFWRFLGGAVLLGVLVYLSVVALVLLVPEQNDYALASNVKHDRLAALPGHRVVLVGGSNLAFGIDSKAIEATVGCPVVNMGMNGYFGVRFMLNEVKPELRAGDVVVLAFEWDNYFKTVDGASTDLLVVSKSNPRAFAAMTWKQRWDVATAGVSYAARQKALRLIGDGLSQVDAIIRGDINEEDARSLIYTIETFSGFTPEGDLVSHLGVDWPYDFEQGIVGHSVDPDVIPMIAEFVQAMEARDVRVVMSYTPLMRVFYDQHVPELQAVHQQLSAALQGRLPRPPQDYVFDTDQFFDTVYHLNNEGRQVRSAQLGGDIAAGNPSTCGGAS